MVANELILSLILVTFAAAIGFGIYSYRRAQKAKQNNGSSRVTPARSNSA